MKAITHHATLITCSDNQIPRSRVCDNFDDGCEIICMQKMWFPYFARMKTWRTIIINATALCASTQVDDCSPVHRCRCPKYPFSTSPPRLCPQPRDACNYANAPSTQTPLGLNALLLSSTASKFAPLWPNTPKSCPHLVAVAPSAYVSRQNMAAVAFDAPVCIAECLTLPAHTDTAFFCALSADTRVAISTSRDTTARVYDLGAGTTRVVLRGHTAITHGCALSADGALAATASLDGSVRVWNTASGEQLLELRRPDFERASGCALTADGRTLIATFFRAVGFAGCVTVVDVRSSATRLVFHRNYRVFRCSISQDAALVAFHGQSGTGMHLVEVLDTNTGQPVHVWTDVAREAGVSLDAYGERLVIADKRELRLFLVREPALAPICFPAYSPSDWRAVCITPCGERVIAPTGRGSNFHYGVWNSRTGALIGGLVRTGPPTDDKTSHGVAVSSNGGVLLGCNGYALCVWNLADTLGTVTEDDSSFLHKSTSIISESSGILSPANSTMPGLSLINSHPSAPTRQDRVLKAINLLMTRLDHMEEKAEDDAVTIHLLQIESEKVNKNVEALNVTLCELQRRFSASPYTHSPAAEAATSLSRTVDEDEVDDAEILRRGRGRIQYFLRIAASAIRQTLTLAFKTWVYVDLELQEPTSRLPATNLLLN
jgi:WD40 repeat protein